jgi:hypothetical protein
MACGARSSRTPAHFSGRFAPAPPIMLGYATLFARRFAPAPPIGESAQRAPGRFPQAPSGK